MTDPKRPSARQAAGTPIDRSSSRGSIPVATRPAGSGSRGAIPAAGRAPSSGLHSAVPTPTRASSGSGRQNAVAPAPGRAAGSGLNRAVPSAPRPASVRRAPVVEAPPPPPPPTHHQRGSGTQRRQIGNVAKKKPPLPKKEILIAAGALFLILAIALTVGYFKKGAVNVEEERIRKQNEILERNVKLATEELKKATDVGTLFTVGKDTIDPKDPSKLFAPFKGNSKIYNVIYNRDYKDKKQADRHDLFALVDDPEHRTISELNKQIPEEKDLNIKYGIASGKPVVVAKRLIHPAKEDLVNTGGQIMVIVYAEEDDFLHKAVQKVAEGPQAPVPPATPGAKPVEPKAPEEKAAPADKAPEAKK